MGMSKKAMEQLASLPPEIQKMVIDKYESGKQSSKTSRPTQSGSASPGGALASLAGKEVLSQGKDLITGGGSSATSALAGGGSGAVDAVGTAIDGGTMMSDGSTIYGPLGLGPTASGVLGAAGVGLGGYGMFNAAKKGDPLGGALSGAGAGLGVAQLAPLLGLGPMGWGAAGIGALAGLGIGGLGKAFGSKERFKTEGKRLKALQDKGITIPEELQGAMHLSKGRSKEELIAIAEANKAAGKHYNLDFANSRDEKDLKAEDIWGYSTMFDKFGNDWLGKYSEDQRRDISQAALDAGAVDEHHGTIDINWTPELQEQIDEITSRAPEAAPAQVQESAPQKQSSGGRRPKLPEFEQIPDMNPPALITEPPPQPDPVSPEDFANAYVEAYNKSQRFLPEANPILRSRY